MTEVKRFFGLVLLGVALWMLARILPERLTTVLWALLALGAMSYLLVMVRTNKQVIRYPLALVLLCYAGVMLYGATRGSVDPLRPWQAFESRPGVPASRAPFLPVKTVDELNLLLGEAARKQQPAVLDLYADWCVACVKMEHEVFGDPGVQSELEGMLLLRADVTGNDAEDGKERAELRLVGETDSAGFLERLERLRR
jgi:thiol:disulfide interchange protein DsbD